MTPIETPTTLESKTIEKLQDLVRINQDSAKGFKDAAEVVSNEQLKRLFSDMSTRRSENAAALMGYVENNGEDTEDAAEGSWRGQLHRWWMELRGKLSGGDAYAVLAEAERGEDQIKAMYEEVLKETAGNAVNDVLLQQYGNVKKGHDTIRDLRDAVKAAN